MLKSIENELKEIEAALDSLQADVKKEKVLLEQGEVRTHSFSGRSQRKGWVFSRSCGSHF